MGADQCVESGCTRINGHAQTYICPHMDFANLWTYAHIWGNIRRVKIESTLHFRTRQVSSVTNISNIYESECRGNATKIKCLAAEVNIMYYKGRIMQ